MLLDRRFHNKLYAGRRRFITQYVEHFPLPDSSTEIAREMIERAKRLCGQLDANDRLELERGLEELVWLSFGLPVEKPSG